jgi:ribonuclease HII
MKQAVNNLIIKPDLLLVDGLHLPGLEIEQRKVVGGDRLCFSIAAASIMAKVARDEFMVAMHKKYPLYNFKQNKGYGTREHLLALRKYGPSPIHRKSFRGVKIENTSTSQQNQHPR